LHYSHRLSWTLSHNRLTQAIERKREHSARLLDLTVSNPTEVFEDYPHEEIRAALARTSDFTYRPDPVGENSARKAIAAWYHSREIAISPERLVLTASSSEAYALLFKLFCDPGDEVLVPVPSYPLFEFLATLESVRIVPYRLCYEGAWHIDFDSLRSGLSSRTRAIVIVNPNNPTGSFLKQSERQDLLEILARYSLPLICDEVFMDYSAGNPGERVRSFIGSDSILSFSLNGLSKSAGMPQMKLGWIAINGPAADCTISRERLELLLDTYLSVSTPVQRALPRLLEIGAEIERKISARLHNNLCILDRLLTNSPAHRLYFEGGWSAILRFPNTMTEENWVMQLLERQDVIVQPGYFFDFAAEPYAVVSLITQPGIFEEGIGRLSLSARQGAA